MIDLGSLCGPVTSPSGINNKGDIVGYSYISGDTRAFLYSQGRMVDLNTLVPGRGAFTLQSAEDINDRGQIVGAACSDTECRSVLLNPVDHIR